MQLLCYRFSCTSTSGTTVNFGLFRWVISSAKNVLIIVRHHPYTIGQILLKSSYDPSICIDITMLFAIVLPITTYERSSPTSPLKPSNSVLWQNLSNSLSYLIMYLSFCPNPLQSPLNIHILSIHILFAQWKWRY